MGNVWNNPKLGRDFLNNRFANMLTYIGQLSREATSAERGLLNQYVHTESAEKQQEILKRIFPIVDDMYIDHFIENTELMPDGWPDRLMDEEKTEVRKEIINEWPIANTKGKINILENDNPYMPLNDEQRIWRKRKWKTGRGPIIASKYYSWLFGHDYYDMPVRKHCIQAAYEILPDIFIDEATLMVDTLFEKMKREEFHFLDKQMHWQYSPECKAKQERERKEKEERKNRNSDDVSDMISQDEIDLLLGGGLEDMTAYYTREGGGLMYQIDSCAIWIDVSIHIIRYLK